MYGGKLLTPLNRLESERIVIHSNVAVEKKIEMGEWLMFPDSGLNPPPQPSALPELIGISHEEPNDLSGMPAMIPIQQATITAPLAANDESELGGGLALLRKMAHEVTSRTPQILDAAGQSAVEEESTKKRTHNEAFRRRYHKFSFRQVLDDEEDDDFVAPIPKFKLIPPAPPSASSSSSFSVPKHGQGQNGKNLSILKQTLRDDDGIESSDSERGTVIEKDILETPAGVFMETKKRLKAMKMRNAIIKKEIKGEIASIQKEMKRMEEEIKRLASRKVEKGKKLSDLDLEERQLDLYLSKIDSIVAL